MSLGASGLGLAYYLYFRERRRCDASGCRMVGQTRDRMASLKRGEGGDLPEEVRALAHWGCDIVHYVEATADAIVFQITLSPAPSP